MNSTNRVMNRLGILFVGMLLVAGGGAVAAASTIPTWSEAWTQGSAVVLRAIEDGLAATTATGMDRSWVLVLVPVVAAILMVLLLVAVFRQGRGRTRTLLEVAPTDAPADGAVHVDGAVAAQALDGMLGSHPGIVAHRIVTWSIRRTPTLGITVAARRGASPGDLRAFVDDAVCEWDALLGRPVPVVVQIDARLVSRFAGVTRVASPHPVAS